MKTKINIVKADLDIIKEIEYKITKGISLNDDEAKYFLDYICYQVREIIALKKSKNIEEYTFSNMCDTAQSMLYHYFTKLNLKPIPVNTHEIIDGVLGHSFLIIHLYQNEEETGYIIDPTYNQFFNEEYCNEERYIIINNTVVRTPHPGYFIDEDNLNIKNFLKTGYIPLTLENVRTYGDSFYKTKPGMTKEKSKKQTMTGNIYIKTFLKSKSKVSQSEEELINKGLNITPLYENEKNQIKRV